MEPLARSWLRVYGETFLVLARALPAVLQLHTAPIERSSALPASFAVGDQVSHKTAFWPRHCFWQFRAIL